MATSAATLSKILELLGKTYGFEVEEAVALLAPKGFLPKKLTEAPKMKKTSKFASKQASDYATDIGLEIPKGFKGTAKDDKISKKDVKLLAEGPKKVKVDASPSAMQFCRTVGLDITKVTGTGTDGKVLLKDVKALKPTDTADISDNAMKLSSGARQVLAELACDGYEIDEADLIEAGIKGTGKEGTVLKKDLDEFVKEIRADEKREQAGLEDETSSEEEED